MVFLVALGCYQGFEWNVGYETNFIDALGTVVLYRGEFEFGEYLSFRTA